MNEQDARRVFDTILQNERFSYREAVKWAITEMERLTTEVTKRDELLSQLYQIVGSMSQDLGAFEWHKVQDLLTEINNPSGGQFLPWPAFRTTRDEAAPDGAERCEYHKLAGSSIFGRCRWPDETAADKDQ